MLLIFNSSHKIIKILQMTEINFIIILVHKLNLILDLNLVILENRVYKKNNMINTTKILGNIFYKK